MMTEDFVPSEGEREITSSHMCCLDRRNGGFEAFEVAVVSPGISWSFQDREPDRMTESRECGFDYG